MVKKVAGVSHVGSFCYIFLIKISFVSSDHWVMEFTKFLFYESLSLSLSPCHDRSSPAVVIIARVMHAFIVFSYLFSYIRLKPGLLQVLHKLHWVSIANQFDWTFSFWETSRNEVHFFFFFVLISSSRQTTTVSAFTSPLMPLFPSSLIGCSSPW